MRLRATGSPARGRAVLSALSLPGGSDGAFSSAPLEAVALGFLVWLECLDLFLGLGTVRPDKGFKGGRVIAMIESEKKDVASMNGPELRLE